jgi:ribonucleoside-diphosphate reductase alpha chain
MEAVSAGDRYDLVHPGRGRPVGRLDARQVFDRLVDAAWCTGDPGLLYLDAIARSNPLPDLGPIEATNPCGEVPLLPWESCVLGSVNLAHMVAITDGVADVDWDRLRHAVHTGVRFLDDVIEINRDPLPPIGEITRGNRKIGLGVMGLAECFVLLGLPYDSDEAIVWADRLLAFIAEEALAASRQLAEERGVFPNWSRSLYAVRDQRVRNATRLSIAPTGTLSIIAGTSAGIEPLFALAYRREHTLGGPPIVEFNPVFLRYMAERHLDTPAVLDAIAASGSARLVEALPPAVRRLFATALEISPLQHLRLQHAVQHHVDNAVSKTINLPEDADADAVAEAFREGWRLGLKGVTVYRSGSRAGQVITLGIGEELSARELFAKCDPDACRL